MKKYTIIFFAAVVAISCKKDPIPILTMGNTSGLIVTEHNIKLETDTALGNYSNSVSLDLDQDDNSELGFKIYEDISSQYVGDNPNYIVEFYVYNDDEKTSELILPEIPTSTDWYVQTEKVYDMLGTYPIETLQETFTCDAVSGSTLRDNEQGAVQICAINADVFSLPETASENNSYSLWSEDYQYEYWEFNEANDSLIGYRKIKEAQCRGLAPFNQLFYIPFKLIYDDSNLVDRIGWIELRLTGNNTLEIFRSAISSN